MSCFSQHILDYFYNIQNTGRIIKPEAIGKAGSKLEGTVIEFSWRVQEGVIKDARFRTFGDVNAIAISSIVATSVVGKEVEEVLIIKPEDIIEHLRENKPNYLYFIHLALEAVANACENYLKKNKSEGKRENLFASSLRENLAKIETGEFVEQENYNLSDVSEKDEENYLDNLNAYENNKENEIKSIEALISDSFSSNSKATNYMSSLNRNKAEEETDKDVQSLLSSSTKGRGRPKKERTAEELELMNRPKLSRGRPRKERTLEELEAEKNKVSRGRGRPKKERTPEELEALANKVSKGRGRPRKERTPEELEAEKNKVLRGRGRPRKDSANPQTYTTFKSENQFKSSFNYMNSFNSLSQNVSSFAPVEEDELQQDIEIEQDENITNSYIENDANYENSDSQEKRGRGRPKKERTAEELEALANKVSKGRGRPRKERTAEELELMNKPKLSRGRPRKERTPEELEAEMNKVSRGRGRPRKNVEETVSVDEGEKRGRGRPRKVLLEENIIEKTISQDSDIKRGRGRPKKYTAIVIQNLKPTNANEENVEDNQLEENDIEQSYFTSATNVEEKENLASSSNEEEKEISNFVDEQNLTNSFAPAQNKYGVGLASLNNAYKTKKVTIKHEEITNTTITKAEYNFTKTHLNDDEKKPEIEVEKVEAKKENPPKQDTKSLKEIMEEEDVEPTEKSSLSENINNILSSGGTIADALKALMED